jgi:hypothetical protein
MFGRKKVADDDPFAALKEGGTYRSTPTTTIAGIPGSGLADQPTGPATIAPAPAAPAAPATPATPAAPAAPATPATPTARPAATYRRTPRSGRGGWIASLVTLGIIVAIAVPIISSASHAIHSFSIPSFSVRSPSIPSVSTQAPTPETPTDYLRPAATRAGIARIARRFPGARVTNLRIDSTSMDALVYPKGGGVKDLTMNQSGTFVRSSAGAGEVPIALSAVPPRAVARIVNALDARFHVPADRIDYIVLTTVPHLAPRWIAFSKAPPHPGYAANLDGSGLQKLGG